MSLGVIDPLLTAPRGDVIGIEVEDLLIFLEGEIVAAGVVVALGITEELLHILYLGDELRAHRLVEIAGLRKVSEKVERFAAIGIITITHHFAHNHLCFRVFAFGNTLLGQLHSALAKAIDRGVMLLGGGEGIG